MSLFLKLLSTCLFSCSFFFAISTFSTAYLLRVCSLLLFQFLLPSIRSFQTTTLHFPLPPSVFNHCTPMVMLFDLRSIWTMISPTTTTTSARPPPSGRIHYLSLTLRFCSNAIPSLSSTFVPVCIGWTGWSRPQLLHKPM